MILLATDANPIPQGGDARMIQAADGLALRVARWACAGAAKGSVVIANGRGEFIEKYFPAVATMLDSGFHVVAFDWRGQGLSARELANPRKGHIDDFSLYERDLDAVRAQVLEPLCPKPWFGLGHSMGGAILLAQAHAGRSPFDRLVLSAPMIDLAGLRFARGTRLLAAALDILGFGGAFIPGGGETTYLSKPFAANVLTSDPARYAIVSDIAAQHPQLALGAPTVGWLNAAFRLMRQFEDPDYAAAIRVPTLFVMAGDDKVVDTPAIARFAARMKAGHGLAIAAARHELLIERDIFAQQFWAAFKAFIPGTVAELEAFSPAAPPERRQSAAS